MYILYMKIYLHAVYSNTWTSTLETDPADVPVGSISPHQTKRRHDNKTPRKTWAKEGRFSFTTCK